MSIKMKILIPILTLTVVTSLSILSSNIIQFSSYVDSNMKNELNISAKTAADKLEIIHSQVNIYSSYIAADDEIIKAIEEDNREALLNRSIQIYNETGIGFCTIADASGIALVRPHKPDVYNDDISLIPSVKSALSGQHLTVIEPGASVKMSICSGSPIYNNKGSLIGVVSVGFRLDTSEFVDSLKTLLNCEATIFLGDERISTTLLKEDGTRAIGTKAATNISEIVLAGNTYNGKIKLFNRNMLTNYSPIFGANGKVIGMLFIGKYIYEKTDTIFSFIKTGSIIMLICLLIFLYIILLIINQIVKPIKAIVTASYALTVGDTEVSIENSNTRETNELANTFNIIIENIQEQTRIIKSISDGDLTVSVKARSDKDIINNTLISMLEQNNYFFTEIISCANQVSAGTKQVAESSQSVARGVTEQASSIEELSITIDLVDKNIRHTASIADQAASLTNDVKNSVEKGSEQMKQMVIAVKEINEASQSINKIIKVIDDIAFQTNILALNAAVEAARAGQHGKGFAVVAEEVRSLASKSAEAAKNTNNLIANSITKAKLGVNIANETDASLSEIITRINESNQIINEIAISSKDQSTLINEINQGINQISHVVHQNSTASDECATASEEMNNQSDILENLVMHFKIHD